MSVDVDYDFQGVRIPSRRLPRARAILADHTRFEGYGGERPIAAEAGILEALGCVRLVGEVYPGGVEIVATLGFKWGAMMDVLEELAPCLQPGGIITETAEDGPPTRYVVRGGRLDEVGLRWSPPAPRGRAVPGL